MTSLSSPPAARAAKPTHGQFKPAPHMERLSSALDREIRRNQLINFALVFCCVLAGFAIGMIADEVFTEINRARVGAEQ